MNSPKSISTTCTDNTDVKQSNRTYNSILDETPRKRVKEGKKEARIPQGREKNSMEYVDTGHMEEFRVASSRL